MRKLVEYTHCLKGGGMIVVSGIRRTDGGLIVVDVRYYPAISQEAA